MKFQSASLVAASLMALFAAGCSTAPSKEAATAGKPALSEEAKSAMADATAAVKNAKANYTLWIPVDKAYKAAEKAAEAGDSATVIKEAKIVTDLSKIATAQASYPSTEPN